MINMTGVAGAGPIWRGVMDAAAALPEYAPREFQRPPNVFPQTVCLDDGTLAADYDFCREHSQTHVELFASDPPGADQRLYRELVVDSFTGLLASQHCNEYTVQRTYLVLPNHSQITDLRRSSATAVQHRAGRRGWRRNLGDEVSLDLPPEETCGRCAAPGAGDHLPTRVRLKERGRGARQYRRAEPHYRVEFGVSHDPIGCRVGILQAISNGVLGMIDPSSAEDGLMTIRLIVDTEYSGAHFT